MSSDNFKQIEKLLLYLRHKDPNLRYKALHQLNKVLFKEEYSKYHNIIIQAISKYSTRDPHDKIRADAKNILYMYKGTANTKNVSKTHLPVRTLILLSVFLVLLIGAGYIFLNPQSKTDSNKPTDSVTVNPNPNIEKNVVEQKTKYSLKLEPTAGYRDSVNVLIESKVLFKNSPLFTNKTTFVLAREVKKILDDGSFVMEQYITEAFGVTSDLHLFGYPNPSEKLTITYSPTGKTLSVKKMVKDL